MQPAAYPIQNGILAQIWHSYMETGQLNPQQREHLDPAVLQSWRRCSMRLDSYAKPRPRSVKGASLASMLKAQSNLVTVATPFIEDIHQFVEGSNCAILLADGAACVLAVAGDATAVEMVNELGLGQGTYWSEGQLGTNALGAAQCNAMPTQIVGAEHYYKAYHHLVSTAAPIHHVNGRIIGIVAVVGPVHTATSHTLALVMAAARAIDNQLHADLCLEEGNRRLIKVNAILGAISEGVIAWGESGKINHVNAPAAQMLQLLPSTVLGQPLTNVLALPTVVAEAVTENKELRDIEASFEAREHPIDCLVSLRPICEGNSHPVGYVMMLRPIEQVRQWVHQQLGLKCILTLEDITAESTAMRQVVRQARIAARGTAPILLRGEVGAGKNYLARAIHNESERADKPFLAINCRAIPHELMVSEFLGHEKNGTSHGRPSKFELANEGTLLLNQIESLSLEMQAALLHLLETGYVMRLDSTRPIAINARIMATTNADLEREVTEGSFLPHLYYRFGVFNIKYPPLRDRVEDIPLMAERFLARLTRGKQEAARLDDQAMAILCRYPWPGNVRELQSVLERALHQSRGGVIRAIDLHEVVRTGRIMTTDSLQPKPIVSLHEAEREAIIRAGQACQGRVTEMAQQLGIGRTTLWRKMKRLNIMPSLFKERMR